MVQVWSKLYNHNAENLLLVLCTTMLLLCLCGVIRFLSLWLKCLLHSSPAAPQTPSWEVFSSFSAHDPVCEPARTTQGHSLLLASACPLVFNHAAHTFFSPLPHFFPCVLPSFRPRSQYWVPATPSHLLTFHPSVAIFLAVGRVCSFEVYAQQLRFRCTCE